MSLEKIKKEIQNLSEAIGRAPLTQRFRGRRVVPAEEWKSGDWSRFPDGFLPSVTEPGDMPAGWYLDYIALMEELQDADYGRDRCGSCAIYEAEPVRKEIERKEKFWREDDEGGKEARYQSVGETYASEFRKDDAMEQVHLRILDEFAGAKKRTCSVVNYLRCPFGKEGRRLISKGAEAETLWHHINWHDHHWNRPTSITPAASEMEWYHFDEKPILDVTSYDDIMKALRDGRMARIIREHTRYMKETGAKIWNL